MGLVTLFNGIDITHTADYIKVSCSTYINKIMTKHLSTWLFNHDIPNHPTPLPSTKTFLTSFINAIEDSNQKIQGNLEKSMKISYCRAIGELIYAMTSCCPNIAYTTVRASQYSTALMPSSTMVFVIF